MKKLYLIAAISVIVLSCQRETDETLRPMVDTRDSLIGRWDFKYTFTHNFSDSTYRVVTDSLYNGPWTPFSFLELRADSTYRWFMTGNHVPPVSGQGYSGKWWYKDATRQIWGFQDSLSFDTAWINVIPYPHQQTGPIRYIRYLNSDSLVLYIQSRRDSMPSSYRRIYDVFRRRR